MKAPSPVQRAVSAGLLLSILAAAPMLSAIEPVSVVGSAGVAGGGGDSGAPVLSADGRYVLFASTAANLLITTNNHGIEPPAVPVFNVFLRDRLAGTTVLVSANLSRTNGGNGSSFPAGLSADARYAVFESSASDLVAGDTNNSSDIFVRDLQAGITRLASAATNGAVGNGESRSAAMTPDGRYVAFVSAANNLTAGDTNGIADVFVRDLQTDTTVLASAGAAGSVTAKSEGPDITPDGRYVVFYSTATNLVGGVTNAQDIYVRDLVGGITTWASSGAGAALEAAFPNNRLVSYNQSISADGKFVAFETSPIAASGDVARIYPATVFRYNTQSDLTDVIHTNAASQASGAYDQYNLDMTPDGQRIAFVACTNGSSGATTCILLWDAGTMGCTLVSGDESGGVVTNATCDWPAIDASGLKVAFCSNARLTTNTVTGEWQLYLRDLAAETTALLNADADGVGSPVGWQTQPVVAANGQSVAFECSDGTLFPNDRNRMMDVVARDIASGVIDLVSTREATLSSLTANGPSLLAANCSSADGRFIVFATDADNLCANDANACRDIYVHDRLTGTNLLVSVNTNGAAGDGISYEPAISPDGRYVVFTSQSDDLVPGDNNKTADVFMRDLHARTTTLISINKTGTGSGNTNSYAATVGAGGRFVMYRSRANNLTNGTFTAENEFVWDRQTGTNSALSLSGVFNAALTPDGRFAIYNTGSVYIWNSALARRVYTNAAGVYTNAAISADGGRIALWGSTLWVTNLGSGQTWSLTTDRPAGRPGLRFSADNRFFTYATVVNKTNRVYLYDFETLTGYLVSHANGSTDGANASADSPDISGDGRFVAYRSAATNIVPGDTNTFPKIFLFDRQTGITTLLSAGYLRNTAGNNRSAWPFFSADGQTLLFQTAASDVTAGDYNQVIDVVAYAISSSAEIPLFSASLVPPAPGQSPAITWPAVQGRSYRVQYKINLDDDWKELNAAVHVVGDQGYCQDLAPSATQRFYRVVGQ